ncbi:MAG TPA: DUF5990 family protein [Mucilaginibacter sp.]|nr:DUF5990 family protein [Mucilaginibacter sp.]
MNRDLTLHIVLQKPPVGVDFGLQKGSGSKYETIQTQRSDGQDMQFKLTVQIKGDRQKGDAPQFTVPFVQGKPLSRFLYIDIGEFAGQVGGWSRRIKIPFSGITWDIISQVINDPNAVLETSFAGTGKDGGPNCATVKPFDGWRVKVLSS